VIGGGFACRHDQDTDVCPFALFAALCDHNRPTLQTDGRTDVMPVTRRTKRLFIKHSSARLRSVYAYCSVRGRPFFPKCHFVPPRDQKNAPLHRSVRRSRRISIKSRCLREVVECLARGTDHSHRYLEGCGRTRLLLLAPPPLPWLQLLRQRGGSVASRVAKRL